MEKAKLFKAQYECPSCHHGLDLEYETSLGLGVYRCRKCGFRRELLIKNP